jgi:hypothetical protein
VNYNITTTYEIDDPVFVVFKNSNAANPNPTTTTFGGGLSFFPNTTNVGSYIDPLDSAGSIVGIALAGVYTDTDENPLGVMVSFANTSGAIGNSFNTVFSPYTESTVMSDMESANESFETLGFMSFLQNVSGVESAIGTTATLVDFSNGASGGSMGITLTPLPEPASLTLLVLGSSLFVRPRRQAKPVS